MLNKGYHRDDFQYLKRQKIKFQTTSKASVSRQKKN